MPMENEYGVRTVNKFAQLLEAEESEDELIAQAEKIGIEEGKKEQQKKKADKKAAKIAASAPISPPVINEAPSKQQDSGGFGSGGKGRGGFGGGPTERRDDKENRPRGRGRGGGAPRGGGARGGQTTPGGGGPTNLPPRLAGQNNQLGGGESNQIESNRGGFGGSPDKMAERFGESGGERGRGRGGRGRGGRGRGGFGQGGFHDGGEDQQRGGFGDNFHSDEQNNRGGGGGAGMGVFGDEENEKLAGGAGWAQQNNFGGTFGETEGRGGFSSGGGGRGRGGFDRGGERRGGRGGNRGGGFRGGRGGRGREFDRNSGSDKTFSGVKSTEKRGGFGAANWGNPEDQAQQTGENGTLNVTGELDAPPHAEERDGPKEEGRGEAEPEEPTEPEAKELTLDEWRALQQPKAKPQFNVRKPEEINKKGEKLIPLERPDLNNTSDSEEYIIQERAPKKQVLNIDIRFSDDMARSGGGGRGGSGGGGYRGGRDGDRPGGFGGRGGGFRGGRGEGRGGGGGGFGGGGGGFRGDRRGGGGGRGGRGGQREFNIEAEMESFPELG